MSTALAIIPPTTHGLVDLFLSGKSPQTLRAYSRDLADFADFSGLGSVAESVDALCAGGQGGAHALVLRYRSALLTRELSPATINRRLAAVRSLVSLGRTLGIIGWTLEVPGVRSSRYRDTRGCGLDGFRLMLALAEKDRTAKGARDRAVLRLLWDLALRRAEVCSLDLSDLDLGAGTISVMGKGRREKETLTLPPSTLAALRSWLDVRGTEPGPLVTNADRRTRGARLTGAGLYHLVRSLGAKVGAVVRPHGIRHASITTALDATGGNVRDAQRFSRHKDTRTLMLYDDNRTDAAGSVAALVSGRV